MVWGFFCKLPTNNSWQNNIEVMFKHHKTEDHPRYSLKSPWRLWTGAKYYNYVCNLYTRSLLPIQSITGMGKLITLLSNVGGNSHSETGTIWTLQSLQWPRTLRICAQSQDLANERFHSQWSLCNPDPWCNRLRVMWRLFNGSHMSNVTNQVLWENRRLWSV